MTPCSYRFQRYTVTDHRLSERFSSQDITRRVEFLAERINQDYKGKNLVLVGILNGAFIFMADRWNPKALHASTYVWLPIRFEHGRPRIEWAEEWGLAGVGA